MMKTNFVVFLLAVGLPSALAAPGQAPFKTIKSRQTHFRLHPIKTSSSVYADEDYKGLLDAIEKVKIDITLELDKFTVLIETLLSGNDEAITNAGVMISTNRKLANKSVQEALAEIPGSTLNDVYLAVFFAVWELTSILNKGLGDLELLFDDVAPGLLGIFYASVDEFMSTVTILSKPFKDEFELLFPDPALNLIN